MGFLRRKKPPLDNLLHMVPLLRSHIGMEPDGERKVILLLPRTSWLERQSIRFLKQPERIKVHLDELGSMVVTHCKGRHSVEQIASIIRAELGDAAEPLYPRLGKYLEILEANGWLTWVRENHPADPEIRPAK